ncbi:hypothetical protein H257_18029 [Aphanomyces astaci]|uniref:Peptidase M13 C-terminal domain-containing protein n=1 Tax=Aphanomyces astaci TaxID=112090 RepID=W4FCH5_APHAT|nr:hypothetical protein H257_18029 [Aphanomyces astaci]ETV65165.1 hypothetical protein H257_18029 [Aphanomyces astaci]|eukprot:XP_009845339.1 hypothetical protein H257_18029 [Aphanomyces astaci]
MPAMVKIIVVALSAGVASAFGTISEFPTEITSLMDHAVDPCTDFYSYSCGTWHKNTTLHANQDTTDVAYTVIVAKAYKLVEKLYNANLPKLAEFYDACMDTATLETLGLAPIEVHLKAIRSANSTVEAIFRGATISKATGVPMFVKLSVSPDAVEITRNVLILDFNAPFLSTLFVEAHSDFYDKVIKGVNEPRSRAMICRGQVETSIGELLGSYYLKEVWTRKTAAEANLLVFKLEAAFKTRLESAEWLDDATRANAMDKLSKFSHLLGGPKNPKTYPTLTFDPKAYIANLNKVSAFDTTFNLDRIDTAVDKHLWNKLAVVLNAFFQHSKNRILIPATFLQPPYFDPKADPSANYGAIGFIIGHEISHGFDNRGSRYDGDGKTKQWWTETTWKQFSEKAECFVEQYGSMDVKSDVTGDFLGKLDGNTTLRENLADNGGVNTAYRAYRDYVHGEAETTKYTKEAGEKMFWIKFAQSWCTKDSDRYLQSRLNHIHPPGRHRVIGALQNSVDFAKVFNCPVDSPMNPTKKCVMW